MRRHFAGPQLRGSRPGWLCPPALVVGVALFGCGAGEPAPCVARVGQSLNGGQHNWPGSGAFERQFIATILGYDGERIGQLCSGVRLGADSVLTAKHCFAQPLTYRVTFVDISVEHAAAQTCTPEDSPGAERSELMVAQQHLSSDADLAVVEFTPPLDASGGLPLATFRDSSAAYFVAGVGVDETGLPGRVRFAPVAIVEVADEWIDVRVGPDGGACSGDSGGPLLVDRDGDIAVVGILSVGSASCRGFDRYLRVDRLREWLDREAPSAEWLPTVTDSGGRNEPT